LNIEIHFADMRTIVCTTFACLLILKGFAADYEDLLRRGYRWVTVDGPYACVSVDDLLKITRNGGDELELKLVEQLKAYYLIRGTMVQVIKEDKAARVSQVRIDGITTPLWTRSAYLSRQPVKNISGHIETPGMLTPSETLGENPVPVGSPTPSASSTPSPSP
jgi:hypothetical protein